MSTNPLNEFLSERSAGPASKRGQLPSASITIPFAEFELRGTRLGFSDPWQLMDAVAVICPSGQYALEAECYCYGDDKRVARVMATVSGRHGERGALYGEFGVDVGNACIFDYDAIEGFADADAEAFDEWGRHHIVDGARSLSGSIPCATAKSTLVYFASGFGDGTYSVYERRDDYEVIGAEVVFLTGEETYPFGE